MKTPAVLPSSTTCRGRALPQQPQRTSLASISACPCGDDIARRAVAPGCPFLALTSTRLCVPPRTSPAFAPCPAVATYRLGQVVSDLLGRELGHEALHGHADHGAGGDVEPTNDSLRADLS